MKFTLSALHFFVIHPSYLIFNPLRRQSDFRNNLLPRRGEALVRGPDEQPYLLQSMNIAMDVLVIPLQPLGKGADTFRPCAVKRLEKFEAPRCEYLKKRPQVLEVETLQRLLGRLSGFGPPPCLHELLRGFVFSPDLYPDILVHMLRSPRLPDISQEIGHQRINVTKMIGFFPADAVSVVTLAPFVVETDQTISFGVPVIESVFQSKRVMDGAWNLPEDHLAQSPISKHKTGTMEQFRDHMVYHTIKTKQCKALLQRMKVLILPKQPPALCYT